MNDILSQDEIDALLQSVEEEKPEGQEAAAAAPARKKKEKNIRVYDFSSPDKFSKDQMRTIQMIHDNFSRFMNSSLSAFLRTVVNTVPVEVTETSYQEFVKKLPDPTVLGIFSMPPLERSAVMQFDTELMFGMYDRLLGGTGEVVAEKRELTDIEQSVIEGVIHRVLSALKEAWVQVLQFEPRLTALETNPAFVTIVAPNDRVASLSFEVKMGEAVGVMHLCLPHITLEPIASKLSAQLWFSGATRVATEASRKLLEKRLARSIIWLRAELGRTKLRTRDLLDMKKGDVIRTGASVGDPVKVNIGEKTKFKGQIGTFKGKMAVQILEACKEDDSG